ncbi:MAG: mannosyltransferase family protein [Anaeromyxobacteraceae bacterium]
MWRYADVEQQEGAPPGESLAAVAALVAAPADRGWFLRAVLYPFALTRAALLLVAWFGTQFAPSWTYFDPVGATRGWSHVPALALDVWGRYDTYWYLNVAMNGYLPPADLVRTQSNLAFFPLYPALIRAVHGLLPWAWQGVAASFAVAVALANVLAVAALAAFYLLVRDVWRDPRLARRAVVYLLAFPAGFFLSCAYSESLYLALSAGAFLLAWRGRWWWSGALALLLGLTRPSGVLLAPALAGLYVSRRGMHLGRLRPDALALLAAPAGLLLHAAHLARLTGDPLALFHAQAAWGRALAAPWTTLLDPLAYHAKMGPFEHAGALLFLALGAALLLERRFALGAFALLSLAPVLLSGTLMSATRFLAVVFPAFAALARFGEREWVDRTVLVLFATGQALLFLAWSRFYWVS